MYPTARVLPALAAITLALASSAAIAQQEETPQPSQPQSGGSTEVQPPVAESPPPAAGTPDLPTGSLPPDEVLPPPPAPPPPMDMVVLTPPPPPPAQICNGQFADCVRARGGAGQAFYVVKKSTFANFATANGTRPFDAGLGIARLVDYGRNLRSIGDAGGLVFRLGQYGKQYWLIPVCGPNVRWQTRREAIMLKDQETVESIVCQE
jgi:hypothetical protein